MAAIREDAQVDRRASAGPRESVEGPAAIESLGGLDGLVAQILADALELVGADFGDVQLYDPETRELKIAAHTGFGPGFLGHFASVSGDDCACGRAAHTRAQTVIDDVELDEGFRPHRAIAAISGFRAVVSTPLVDRAGTLRGVVSTHFREPGRPAERELRALRIYARLGGEALARSKARDAGGTPTEALSEAVESALRRIFSASLALTGAQAAAVDTVWRERLGAAVSELDRAIKQIQAAVIAVSPG